MDLHESKPLLFRCHSIGQIMSEPRAKADKEAGKISETAKTLVLNMWLFKKFGYQEKIMTDALMKGLTCEQDSMELVQSVLGGEFRIKNKANLVNDYLVGTPDIILKNSDYVEDVKTSLNLRTFFESELNPAYYAQAQAYMALTGKNNYRLIYCLIPSSFEMVTNAKKRLYYQFDCNESNQDYIEMCEQIEHNNDLILNIPKKNRINIFEFEKDQDFIEKMYSQVQKCRNYYDLLESAYNVNRTF